MTSPKKADRSLIRKALEFAKPRTSILVIPPRDHKKLRETVTKALEAQGLESMAERFLLATEDIQEELAMAVVAGQYVRLDYSAEAIYQSNNGSVMEILEDNLKPTMPKGDLFEETGQEIDREISKGMASNGEEGYFFEGHYYQSLEMARTARRCKIILRSGQLKQSGSIK